ncbi:MAG: TfoX/Sxy family protein [Burkholderiaceae bacterium]
MSTRRDGFVQHCLDLLGGAGEVRARRMFGGHGVYLDELFVALVIGERLYLKADAQTRARFDGAGCTPFVYQAAGKAVTLGYFSAPTDAIESQALMQPWARLALEAALRARTVRRVAAPRRARARAPATKARARKGSLRSVADQR